MCGEAGRFLTIILVIEQNRKLLGGFAKYWVDHLLQDVVGIVLKTVLGRFDRVDRQPCLFSFLLTCQLSWLLYKTSRAF